MSLDLTNFGWVANAFCFSIYGRSLQYECMEKILAIFNFDGFGAYFVKSKKFHASTCNCSQKVASHMHMLNKRLALMLTFQQFSTLAKIYPNLSRILNSQYIKSSTNLCLPHSFKLAGFDQIYIMLKHDHRHHLGQHICEILCNLDFL